MSGLSFEVRNEPDYEIMVSIGWLCMHNHVDLGELYLEYLRYSCGPLATRCQYCKTSKWQSPVMGRIPRPFPDEKNHGHYLDVFSTPTLTEDGSPREINDFLPRANIKKRFFEGILNSSDKQALSNLSRELCVSIDLLRVSIKHYEELKVLNEMRARKRKQDR